MNWYLEEILQKMKNSWNNRSFAYSFIKFPPPPTPPSAPTIIEVVDDIEEIEETVIQSTETDQESVIDAPIIAVDEVVVEVEEEGITVPFAVMEDVPIFPGCDQAPTTREGPVFNKKFKNTWERISNIHRLPLRWAFMERCMCSLSSIPKAIIPR